MRLGPLFEKLPRSKEGLELYLLFFLLAELLSIAITRTAIVQAMMQRGIADK